MQIRTLKTQAGDGTCPGSNSESTAQRQRERWIDPGRGNSLGKDQDQESTWSAGETEESQGGQEAGDGAGRGGKMVQGETTETRL